MIAIELLKGLKPVMLEPQIPGQMFRFEQMVLMVVFYERAIIISDQRQRFIGRC
jgi:hypothetical protein